MLCIPFLIVPVKAKSGTIPYSILFDEAHNQYYTYSNSRFKTALDYLNQTLEFKVYLNKVLFDNVSKLSPYDLVIIGNPGPKGNFSSKELTALKNYTLQGGDLFLLGNYNDIGVPTPDGNLTGHASYLNNITRGLALPVLFTSYDLWDKSGSPNLPLGERWVIDIKSSNFQTFHPITQKLNNVLVFTSGLNVTEPQNIIATGYPDSYLINRTNDLINETPWLFATQNGASKIILCGSTAIFSDTNITNALSTDYTGIHWIHALDNLRLWANIIQWASMATPPDFLTMFIVITLIIIAVGVSLFIYYSRFAPPKPSTVETKKQNLLSERDMILKEAQTNIDQGNLLSAAQLYKRAARLSNQLGELPEEANYMKKYQKLLARSKK